MNPQPQTPDLKNLIVAFVLSMAILFVWQMAVPPAVPPVTPSVASSDEAVAVPEAAMNGENASAVEGSVPQWAASREEAVVGSRLQIESPKLSGSIALQGAGIRFDDLTLRQYRTEVEPQSDAVTLLNPIRVPQMYFAEFGWTSSTPGVELPNEESSWQADSKQLVPGKPVTLRWMSGQGVEFVITLTLDENYMFKVTREVRNAGEKALELVPYALVNRRWQEEHQATYISHEGPFGVFDQTLEEVAYKDLQEKKRAAFHSAQGGWAGIADKYWFTAIIAGRDAVFDGRFSAYQRDGFERYQVDVAPEPVVVAPGQNVSGEMHFYAGPKELALLDHYAEAMSIPLFDRALDLGVMYFLTKPFLLMLQTFFGWFGNFGLAIMALTVMVRLVMFPLANKSYKSIAHMKLLQPKMEQLKEKYGEDRMKLQQELMSLYKREKVNPMAGCLPILIQIPVFFALYKVLYVSIEMRHAPFYGWIHDLSAPDPTSLFNLFGLIPYTPPEFLMIGVWPLLMTVSMVIQQQLQPTPTDPVQEKVLKFMPYMFLFLFAHFAAGLVIYWTWNNALSVLQQWVMIKRHPHLHTPKKRAPKKAKA